MDHSKKFLMASGEFSLTMPLAMCRGWEFTKSTTNFYIEHGYLNSTRHKNIQFSGVIYYAHNKREIQLLNSDILLQSNIPCWPSPYTIALFSSRFDVLKKCDQHFLVDHSVQFGVTANDIARKSFPSVVKAGCDEHSGEQKFLVKSRDEFERLELNEEFSIEPYFEGRSVRVMSFDDEDWIIEFENENSWIKNSVGSDITRVERLGGCQLRDHARQCKESFMLDMSGCDYIIDNEGKFHFLEVNCYPQLVIFNDELRISLNKFFMKKMQMIEDQSMFSM